MRRLLGPIRHSEETPAYIQSQHWKFDDNDVYRCIDWKRIDRESSICQRKLCWWIRNICHERYRRQRDSASYANCPDWKQFGHCDKFYRARKHGKPSVGDKFVWEPKLPSCLLPISWTRSSKRNSWQHGSDCESVNRKCNVYDIYWCSERKCN